jgi:SAM-dependent methyltransferase
MTATALDIDAAQRTLDGWFAGAQALVILTTALDAGLLAAAHSPRLPGEIAIATELDERRAGDLCLALAALGVLDCDDGRYALSPGFASLAAPDTYQPLAVRLAGEAVIASALATTTAHGGTYHTLAPADRAALARLVAPLPIAPAALAWVASFFRTLPELHTALADGGTFLELGCGAGGVLLSTLALYPGVTAVGVDLDACALEQARRHAGAAGVADRLELRHADAREIADEAIYSVAFWSQLFFSAASRAATLAAARRALQPGAYLVMTCFWGGEPPVSLAALREPAGRYYARNRLLFGNWGLPALTREQLAAEAEAAGFEIVRVAPVSSIDLMLARRPPDDDPKRRACAD